MNMWFYIFLAMIGAIGLSFGLVLQKKGAQSVPKLKLKGFSIRSFLLFFKSKIWVTGLACSTAGWVLYLVAVSKGPISIIQPVFGFGLVVIALFGVCYYFIWHVACWENHQRRV